MGNKRKQPKSKAKYSHSAPKVPRRAERPDSSDSLSPVWLFSMLDTEGPWGRCGLSTECVWSDILPKILNFESMRWSDFHGDTCHSVEVWKLIPEARKRIEHLNLDDVDELWRFRLTGLQRLWGIREGERFKILWWDPKHEICPSQKKHT